MSRTLACLVLNCVICSGSSDSSGSRATWFLASVTAVLQRAWYQESKFFLIQHREGQAYMIAWVVFAWWWSTGEPLSCSTICADRRSSCTFSISSKRSAPCIAAIVQTAVLPVLSIVGRLLAGLGRMWVDALGWFSGHIFCMLFNLDRLLVKMHFERGCCKRAGMG